MTGRAADQVVQAMSQRIRDGSIANGQPIPAERDLMAEFNISRTVAREAVGILSSQGLVVAKPRHRPVVRKPGYDAAMDAASSIVGNLLLQPSGVRNLFDTRILVEGSLVRNAAERAGKQDIADLKTALAANEAAIEDSDLFYQTDMQFHQVFYQISGNPVWPSVHRAYSTWLEPHWRQMPRLPDRNKANFTAHSAILEAILLRDPDAAESQLKTHLAEAWEQVRLTFGDI